MSQAPSPGGLRTAPVRGAGPRVVRVSVRRFVRPRRPIRVPRGRDESGSISPAVPIIAIMLFLLTGLVVDSSRDLDARARAQAYAEEGARAGAERIQLTEQDALIDTKAAQDAVGTYCAQAMSRESAISSCRFLDANQNIVRVEVQITVSTTMLSAVGLTTMTATGIGAATTQQGVLGVSSYPGVPGPSISLTSVPLPGLSTGTATSEPVVTPTPTTTTPTGTGSPTLTPTGSGAPPTSTPPRHTTPTSTPSH